VHLHEKVVTILGSLLMKAPGKCSYFMEGVSKSVPHPFHGSYTVFQNHTHYFPTFVAYCTILYLASGDGIAVGFRLDGHRQ
jgi:hypothetical protein